MSLAPSTIGLTPLTLPVVDRDGNDSASSVDDDAFSEDETSQSFSESYSESGSMGRDQVLPLRVKVCPLCF